MATEILSFINQYPDGTTEYEIIKHLENLRLFQDLAAEDELALFQKHFIVMNSLYQLQADMWRDDNIFLDISSVRVRLIIDNHNEIADSTVKSISDNSALSGYYLDWENFKSTDQEKVLEMLNGFWQLFYNQDKISGAYQTLDLSMSEPLEIVTKQYRKLAAIHHPDKGGNRDNFIAIRQAYEVIKQSNKSVRDI